MAPPSPTSPAPSASARPPRVVYGPLTGLPVASKARARRPALAVKIDNAVAARPHAGLDRADIVYEVPVEGGVTRFIAIFQSRDAATVGPIRSSRLSDIDVLAEYGRPLLAFSGAAGYVLAELPKANVVLLPHGSNGSIYWRQSGRFAPHNLMSSTRALYAAARGGNATPAPRLFGFDARVLRRFPTALRWEPSASPSPLWPSGEGVRVPFSSESWTAVWRYHARTGLYRRAHGSVPHRAADGKRITARNVIVMRVGSQVGGRPGGAGASTPQLQLVGSGAAVLLRDGVRINGRWSRSSAADRTVFTDDRGRPFALAPGNTWIEVVPTTVRPSYR